MIWLAAAALAYAVIVTVVLVILVKGAQPLPEVELDETHAVESNGSRTSREAWMETLGRMWLHGKVDIAVVRTIVGHTWWQVISDGEMLPTAYATYDEAEAHALTLVEAAS